MMDSDINLADGMKRKFKGSISDGDDDEENEVFHFIAYVHVDDALWELDGLKKQPVKLGIFARSPFLSFPFLSFPFFFFFFVWSCMHSI